MQGEIELDDTPSKVTLSVEPFGPDLGRDGNKWSGASLGADGCIYCVPYLASQVLRIDPAKGSVERFGPDLGSAGNK